MFQITKTGARILPLIGLMALLIGIVVPPAQVFAQAATTRPPLSLTTSPIPLSVVTQPGKTVTADLRVKNNGTQPEQLKIELLKFGASGESGNPQLRERETKDTYFEWVSFSERQFSAEPGVWKTVKMTIKTPPDAAFGYYLAVLFSRAAPDKPTGGASAVEGGVASLVLLDVQAPGAKREAKIVNLTADRKVYEFLPATLKVRVTNSGNVHVSPTGSIFIKRGGTQVGKPLEFNTQRGNILPGSKRSFEAVWSEGFPHFEEKTEGGKTSRSLVWNFGDMQNFRIGHYTATLVAVYDDGQRDIPIEATVGFWVIPWRIIGVILLVLLLITTAVVLILRGIWKKVIPPKQPSGRDGPSDPPAAQPDPAADKQSESRPEAASDSDTASEPPAPDNMLPPVEPVDPSTSPPAAPEAASAPILPAPKPVKTPQRKPAQTPESNSLPTDPAAAQQSDQRKTAPELKE